MKLVEPAGLRYPAAEKSYGYVWLEDLLKHTKETQQTFDEQTNGVTLLESGGGGSWRDGGNKVLFLLAYYMSMAKAV